MTQNRPATADDLFALLDNPINGAFWAGPPFPSARWNEATAKRKPGSPHVAPEVGDGRLIRFASHFRDAGGPGIRRGAPREILQHRDRPSSFVKPRC